MTLSGINTRTIGSAAPVTTAKYAPANSRVHDSKNVADRVTFKGVADRVAINGPVQRRVDIAA